MSVLTINFMSNTLNRHVTYKAIIPIENSLNPSDNKDFKTLYLLHGMLGNCEDWIHNTRIVRLARKYKIAVIMPSGDNSFYVDHKNRQDYYGKFIGEELVNHSRLMFPLSKKREDTFIAGLSMGGYGAIRNGLKYHETFSHIGGFSSGLILEEAIHAPIEHDVFFRTRAYFESVFGNLDELAGSDCDYRALILQLKEAKCDIPKLYLSCGTEDHLISHNREYRDFLIAENIELTYLESKGDHDWDFWDEYIEKFLQWLPFHA